VIEGLLASLDGRVVLRRSAHCAPEEGALAGADLADELLDAGGRALLADTGGTPLAPEERSMGAGGAVAGP
jgi:hypothetical protein